MYGRLLIRQKNREKEGEGKLFYNNNLIKLNKIS